MAIAKKAEIMIKMDEKELAERVHQAIVKAFSEASSKKLMKIVVSCDAMDKFDINRVNAHWRRIANESWLVNSHIELQHRLQIAKCVMCNNEFEIDNSTLVCPFCKCEQFKITHKPPTIESYQTYQ